MINAETRVVYAVVSSLMIKSKTNQLQKLKKKTNSAVKTTS